jgi:hypothetical protein
MGESLLRYAFWVKHEKWIARFLVFICLGVSAGLAISSVLMDSATDDEPAHIATGYIKLRYGYFDIYNEQPPLIDSLCAVPLLFGHFNLSRGWEATKNPWSLGALFLYGSGNDADRILFLARMPIIILFLLLCLAVYRWVYDTVHSRAYALLGVLLAAFCPNLLGHGRLATVDLGVSLFIYLSAYFYLRFLYFPTVGNIVLTGLAVGAAGASKVSGLILIPYFGLLFIAFMLYESKRFRSEFLGYALRHCVICVIAVVVIMSVYLIEMSRSYIAAVYPATMEHWWGPLAIPFYEYGKHYDAVYKWVSNPYDKPQFLLGNFSSTGWWYYYLVAFVLKTPIGTLILLFFSGAILYRGISRKGGIEIGRKRAYFHLISLFIFVFLFLAISCASKINLGVRYILPIFPFIYTLIPLAMHYYYSSRKVSSVRTFALSCVIVWILSSTIRTHPSYLSYFNELIGNQRNADKYLIDSNLDWGQDLRRLVAWVNENNLTRIHVDYFGGGEPAYYLGSTAVPWRPSHTREEGYYAISRHHYRTSSIYSNRGIDYERYLANAEYITTIGGSIYVFRVE